jgi:hypothetical protein
MGRRRPELVTSPDARLNRIRLPFAYSAKRKREIKEVQISTVASSTALYYTAEWV